MAINVLQIVGGPAVVTFNSSDLGSTAGGVVVKTEVEHQEMYVDQSTMLIGKLAKKKKASVEFVLSEFSSENLQMALGSSQAGFGGDTAAPVAALTVAGVGPSSKTRTLTFHKASVSGSTEVKFGPGEQIGIKVTLDIIADLTKDADKQLFTWADA